MYWHHRLVRELPTEAGEWFSIREIYYDDDKNIILYSKPRPIVGQSIEELREDLETMLRCLHYPAIDFKDLPKIEDD